MENTFHWNESLQFVKILWIWNAFYTPETRLSCFLCSTSCGFFCMCFIPLLDGASVSLLRCLLALRVSYFYVFILMTAYVKDWNGYLPRARFASCSANFCQWLLFFTQSWLYGMEYFLQVFIFLVFLLHLFYALLLLNGTCQLMWNMKED